MCPFPGWIYLFFIQIRIQNGNTISEKVFPTVLSLHSVNWTKVLLIPVVELSIDLSSNNFLSKSPFSKMQSSRYFIFSIIQFGFPCWTRLHHHSNSPVAQLRWIHIWLQFFSPFLGYYIFIHSLYHLSISARAFESLKERCYRILKGLW